jgi:hypothetical protein
MRSGESGFKCPDQDTIWIFKAGSFAAFMVEFEDFQTISKSLFLTKGSGRMFKIIKKVKKFDFSPP